MLVAILPVFATIGGNKNVSFCNVLSGVCHSCHLFLINEKKEGIRVNTQRTSKHRPTVATMATMATQAHSPGLETQPLANQLA
jgi:hypothetical protein